MPSLLLGSEMSKTDSIIAATMSTDTSARCTPGHAPPDALMRPQREALHALGVTGARPPLALASTDPTAYVRALARASQAAELTAPGGLGAALWNDAKPRTWGPQPPWPPTNGEGGTGPRPLGHRSDSIFGHGRSPTEACGGRDG